MCCTIETCQTQTQTTAVKQCFGLYCIAHTIYKLKMYNLSKICRTCLSVENVLKSIFSSNTDSTLLFCDMLMAVSNVKVN